MTRRTVLLAAAALLALLLPTMAAGAYGGGGYPTNGIIGTITDGEGHPIEYIGVRGFKLVAAPGRRPTLLDGGRRDLRDARLGRGGHRQALLLPEARERGGGQLAPQWYDDALTIEAATPIVVPAGTWVTANAAMSGPGSIVGRVTDAATGDPIEGDTVRAHLAPEGRSRAAAGPLRGDRAGHRRRRLLRDRPAAGGQLGRGVPRSQQEVGRPVERRRHDRGWGHPGDRSGRRRNHPERRPRARRGRGGLTRSSPESGKVLDSKGGDPGMGGGLASTSSTAQATDWRAGRTFWTGSSSFPSGSTSSGSRTAPIPCPTPPPGTPAPQTWLTPSRSRWRPGRGTAPSSSPRPESATAGAHDHRDGRRRLHPRDQRPGC